MGCQAPHHSLGCVNSSEADFSGRQLQPALGLGLPARFNDGQLMKLCGMQVTWTPETEPAVMRASLPARIGQEKPHESQTPQPRADHPQVAHR